MLTWLYMGLRSGLDYAVHARAVAAKDAKELLEAGWKILIELAEKQARRITEERPVAKFLGVLRELLSSGEVCTKYVGPLAGDEENVTVPPNGFVGWQENNWYYLLPDVVFKYVFQFCAGQGGHFPVTARTLWKHLDAEGLIFAERAGNETRRLV